MTDGILKDVSAARASQQLDQHQHPAKRSITWNEENLRENESNRTATMKITEPKTPFVYYNDAGDEIIGIRDIDGNIAAPEKLEEIMAQSIFEAAPEMEDPSSNDPQHSPSFSANVDFVPDFDHPPSDDEEDEDNSPEALQRKQEFAHHRKMHYHMGNALKNRDLMLSDDDSDDE
ncbi:hypothetical protein H696_01209 [Fonticula alba]|uniref:Protein phosphatase inhibitor 2 n=1 Tax=Fonticula alba TaxID=691883 RepID=A0A058ZCX6_FONAL|nr:hypothetical protein H696_01209 [Fonticula alba]KCV71791.1 hypothetical protein H696_01209 [Fonticula alba]|eukprot:XP_009493369.1 hypothetical protein H696_01209 [Fonticula alba]